MNKLIHIIKTYDRPDFKVKPNLVDRRRADRLETLYLKGHVARLNDKVRRLKEEIEDEVKMLNAAMEGRQETYDQVKRRISRLKGSLEYRGREDFKKTGIDNI